MSNSLFGSRKAGKQPELYGKDQMGTQHPRNPDHQIPAYGGEAPPPGSESVGPSMFDLVRETQRAREVTDFLIKQAAKSNDRQEIDIVWTFNFDTSGNFTPNSSNPMYTVPNGFIVKFTRFVFDVVGFTPAVPYAAAAAWQGIYRDGAAVGNLIDFAPASAGGAMFPGLYEYNEASAPRLFGGQNLVMRVVGTAALASLSGACRIRAVMEGQS